LSVRRARHDAHAAAAADAACYDTARCAFISGRTVGSEHASAA